jgi:hypothetical protein
MYTIRKRCPVYVLLKCHNSTLSSSIGEVIAEISVRGGGKINCQAVSSEYNINFHVHTVHLDKYEGFF